MTLRTGGVSRVPWASLNLGHWVDDVPESVAENERRLESALACRGLARLRLEHGDRILAVSAPGLYGPADALATLDDDLALSLTVADCYPVALWAKVTPGAAARVLAHCGWRGTAAGLLRGALAWFGRLGIDPLEVRAWIGPGIGACCYPVGSEVAAHFPEAMVPGPHAAGARHGSDHVADHAASHVADRTADRTADHPADPAASHLDLGHAIAHRLQAAGMTQDSIQRSGECTSCEMGRFFSHRRDGYPTGRMAAVFWQPREG